MKTDPIVDNQLNIHCFTIENYHSLAKFGILNENDNVELIEGRIIDMTPIGSKHASCVSRLNEIFSERLQKRAIISIQNPIVIGDDSEPEPDLTIVKRRTDFYADLHPCPEDVLLIIEVADTSLEYDRSIKIPIYSKADIQDMWLIDLQNSCVEIYRSPSSEGYHIMTRLDHTKDISPLNFPDISITVSEVLGMG